MDHDLIEVCPERFAKLEELEKNLPEIIKKAIFDYKKENLRKLHENDKNNPEAVKNRVKKYIEKNKDKINEKRREKRKLSNLQQNTNQNLGQSTLSSINRCTNDIYEPNIGITLRFNS